MWIFTIYGFFSIAMYQKDVLNVRARLKAHIVALKKRFPQLTGKIITLPGRDYLFRIEVSPAIWEGVVSELVKEQTWSNFKNEAEIFNGEDDYVAALHEVWEVMYKLQTRGVSTDRSKRFVWEEGDLKPSN